MHDPHLEPPVNPLPRSVLLVFLAIAGVEAGLALGEAGLIGGPGAVGWRLGLVRDHGFADARFDLMLELGEWPLSELRRLITYPFIHLGFMHGLFAVVLLLALGKMVAEVLGDLVFLILFFASSIGGAVIYAVIWDDPIWLVGAYPGVYGLIGGYSFIMWRQLAGTGAFQYRAFSLIALLMGIQLLWGVFFEVGTQWMAELAGFFCGFALCFICAPGEWARILNQLRRR